jgi:CSLREA domain-containing protein
VFVACTEQEPPTAPAETGGLAFDHTGGHKVVNSLADPGDGTCNVAQCTLREAIRDPQSTEISFAPGLDGPITLASPSAGGGTLVIEKALTITGPSTGIVIRRRSTDPDFRIFRIVSAVNVTLTRLIIRGGTTDRAGGGIVNFGRLALTNCMVAGNSGSGIDNHGTLTLTNSTVARNSAANGGGIATRDGSSVTLTNSTVANNSATEEGGGIFNNVQVRSGIVVTLTNTTVSGNSARRGGGIFAVGFLAPANVSLTNSTVADNSATQQGGGIDADFEAFVRLTNGLVARNSAPRGPTCSTAVQQRTSARASA